MHVYGVTTLYKVSLLHHQMTTNSTVNRTLACVIIITEIIPLVYELIKSKINELLI